MRLFTCISLLLLASVPMLATNIAITDPNLGNFGWGSTPGGYYPFGTNAGILFEVNVSTTLQATFYGNSTLSFSIDGGAPIAVSALSNSTLTLTTVSSSLAPGNHKVYVWATDFTVLSAPAAFVTDGTGTVSGVLGGPVYSVTSAPFSSFGQIYDCPFQSNTNQGYPAWPFAYGTVLGDPSTEFGVGYYATGSAQTIYVYTASQTSASYALYQDGVYVGTGSATANGPANFQPITVSGLDGGQHLYEWASTQASNGANGGVYVMPSGSLASIAAPARQCVGIYGDSIVAESLFSSADTRLAWWAGVHAAGFSLMRLGQGGAVVAGQLENDTSAITGGAFGVPGVVIHEAGVNDQQAYVNAGSISTFQASVQNELVQMASGMAPGGEMLWEEILPNIAAQTGERGAYIAAEIAAVAAYNAGLPSVRACAYNTDGWINTGNDTLGDGLHPAMQNVPSAGQPFGNPLVGYGKISNRLSFILAGHAAGGSSITASGPAQAIVGSPSSVFTIAPGVSGATFSGEKIALGDGGANGAICKVGGGCGTGSLTITTSPGDVLEQFTYTASVLPVSISYTPTANAGVAGVDCWTAPASSLLTSTVQPTFILMGSKK